MAFRNLSQEFGFKFLQQTVEGMTIRIPPSDFKHMTVQDGHTDPFSTSTTQLYPLGTELYYADRVFRYAQAGGTALAVGKLMQSVVPLAGHIDEAVAVSVAGDTTLTFTPNTVTTDDLAANELADGYIYINDDTGEGYAYRIKSHPAITGGTAGVLTLYDPVLLATGASATATVLHHRYRKVIIHPSPPTAAIAGVTVCPIAANSYGWLQVQGLCPVLIDGTVVIKNSVVPSANTDGAVMAAIDFQLEQIVGHVMAVNATTEYGAILLSIP